MHWELRASHKGWSEQEFWVAKQSQCFGPAGLILSSFFVFRVKQTGWLLVEPLGKQCHRLALLTPGASQAHPVAPGSAVQLSLPSLSQCHPCCTVSLLSLPCPCPWTAVPVPADWLLSEDKVMPIRQWTVSPAPWPGRGAPAGYLCSVSRAWEAGRRERAWAKPAVWATLGEKLSCSKES